MDHVSKLVRPASGILVLALALPALASQRLTSDAVDESWGPRTHALVGGRVLYTDGSIVFLHDASEVQAQAAGALPAVMGDSLSFGAGTEADSFVAGWIRGDDAWVWSYKSSSPVDAPVKVGGFDNPQTSGASMSARTVATADGCAFVVAADTAGGHEADHVFSVNMADGSTHALTDSTPGAGASELATSLCKAAYVFETGSRKELRVWDPTRAAGQQLAVVDSGGVGQIAFVKGRLSWTNVEVSGLSDVYLYDTTQSDPVKLKLSTDGRSSHPATDGDNVVWIRRAVDNTYDLVASGIAMATFGRRPAAPVDAEVPVQLDEGQLLWKDQGGVWEYDDGTNHTQLTWLGTGAIRPVLQNGRIAYLLEPSGEKDQEVFLAGSGDLGLTAPTPATPLSPPIALQATSQEGQFTLTWAPVAGAEAYDLFIAKESGVSRQDYLLPFGGAKVENITSPLVVTELPGTDDAGNPITVPVEDERTYYLTVSARVNGADGPSSREINVTPGKHFSAVASVAGIPAWSVAADQTSPNLAFAGLGANCDDGGGTKVAGCDIYSTIDRNASWTPATGKIGGLQVRSLFLDGEHVLGASTSVNGIDKVVLSHDRGKTWNEGFNTPATGNVRKGLGYWVQSPPNNDVAFADAFRTVDADNDMGFMLSQTNGDAGTWAQVAASRLPPGYPTPVNGILDYDMGTTVFPHLYFFGEGATKIVVLGDWDGDPTTQEWLCSDTSGCYGKIGSPPGKIYAMRFDNEAMPRIFAGTDQGLYRSDDNLQTWYPVNDGLPEPPPAINKIFIFDRGDYTRFFHEVILLATDVGLYESIDGGHHWSLRPLDPEKPGAPQPAVRDLTQMGNDRLGQYLLLATDQGLLSAPWIEPLPPSADVGIEYHCDAGETTNSEPPVKVGDDFRCTATIYNTKGPTTALDVEVGLSFDLQGFILDDISIDAGTCGGFPDLRCYVSRLPKGGTLTIVVHLTAIAAGTYTMGANVVEHSSKEPNTDDNGFDIKVEAIVDGGTGGTVGEAGSGGSGGVGGPGGTSGSGGTGGEVKKPGCGCGTPGSPLEATVLSLGVAYALLRRRRNLFQGL